MNDWYFPFNWNVKDIWELEGRIEYRNIDNLIWHLDIPFWSSERGNGMMFDITPREVLNKADVYHYHNMRIKNANTDYPVCLVKYKGREIIMDGIHRLARLVSEDCASIRVKVINEKAVVSVAKYT